MLAKDVMTTNVATVLPDATVEDIAKTLLDRHVSALPVVNESGHLLGIVSEGDLMRRPESDTEGRPSWWLAFLELPENDSRRYVKAHGRYALDVMTRDVITANEDCPVEEIATILEKHHIKRVPIMRDGKLVGIVSRADLLRGLASSKPTAVPSTDDLALRQSVEAAIRQHTGVYNTFIGVIVTDGVVRLWGGVEDPVHKDTARVAAENVPGVRSVEDHISVFPSDVRTVLWTE